MKILKSIAIATALSWTSVTAFAAPETPAVTEAGASETLVANVNGLVCDFCAQSIRKIVGKDASVQKVEVNLTKGEVRVNLKPGKSLDDAALEKLIRKAGYSLVSVSRIAAQ